MWTFLEHVMLAMWQLLHSPLAWVPALIATILLLLWLLDRALAALINLNRFKEKP